jgi:hypothetical protein
MADVQQIKNADGSGAGLRSGARRITAAGEKIPRSFLARNDIVTFAGQPRAMRLMESAASFR